jgi:hypothetical protein
MASRLGRCRPLNTFVVITAVSVALVAWRALLIHEEEEEEGGDIGAAARSAPAEIADLDRHQREYLAAVDQITTTFSRGAAHRLLRARSMDGAALAAAGLVPVAIAADLPSLIAAMLGALAAICQGSQQMLQDRRQAVEMHSMAVGLSRARRRLAYNLGRFGRSDRDAVFDRFVAEAEDVSGKVGDRLISVLMSADSAKTGS